MAGQVFVQVVSGRAMIERCGGQFQSTCERLLAGASGGFGGGSLACMASDSTNQAIEQMRRRHSAQESALRAVAVARGAVEKAQDRRAVELGRLDAAVSEAERGHDEALAVLAEL